MGGRLGQARFGVAVGRRVIAIDIAEIALPVQQRAAHIQCLLIALLLGILAVLVFALSAGALFVFAIGVALAFFLVPVVNRLERRGTKR